MKKTMILLLCFLTTILNAQQDSFPQDTDKKNEITLTPLVLIVSGWADISYEYLINNKSSFGVDVQFNDNKKYLIVTEIVCQTEITEISLLPLIIEYISLTNMQEVFL